jgi:hypothetical protein
MTRITIDTPTVMIVSSMAMTYHAKYTFDCIGLSVTSGNAGVRAPYKIAAMSVDPITINNGRIVFLYFLEYNKVTEY